MESEEDDKFSTRFPPAYNPQMKAAFLTVADYQSADKAKDLFGFRRNTFQNTSSVLSASKSGAPTLGLDRKQDSDIKSSLRTPNNKDIASGGDSDTDGIESGFARLQTEKLPMIKFPMQTIQEKEKKIMVKRRETIRKERDPLPLQAVE